MRHWFLQLTLHQFVIITFSTYQTIRHRRTPMTHSQEQHLFDLLGHSRKIEPKCDLGMSLGKIGSRSIALFISFSQSTFKSFTKNTLKQQVAEPRKKLLTAASSTPFPLQQIELERTSCRINADAASPEDRRALPTLTTRHHPHRVLLKKKQLTYRLHQALLKRKRGTFTSNPPLH